MVERKATMPLHCRAATIDHRPHLCFATPSKSKHKPEEIPTHCARPDVQNHTENGAHFENAKIPMQIHCLSPTTKPLPNCCANCQTVDDCFDRGALVQLSKLSTNVAILQVSKSRFAIAAHFSNRNLSTSTTHCALKLGMRR